MWADHIVSDINLRRVDDDRRFGIDVRLNWSRSVPMSCLEEITVSIDGERVDDASMVLTQGGTSLDIEGWGARDDIWWPVLEHTSVTATAPRRLEPGPHRITLELRVRVPAFHPGPDGIWPTRFNRGEVTATLA